MECGGGGGFRPGRHGGKHKQQFSASQGACGKLLTTNHPTINHNNQIEHKEEEDVTRAEEWAHHGTANVVLELPAMKENTAPATRAAPKGNHVVYSRAAEAKESVIHHSNALSCPVKKTTPVPAARKLSLGGDVGVKPKAVREVGAGNAKAGSRILVFVRLWPMSRKEKEAGSRNCVKIVKQKDIYLTEFASEIDYLRLKRVRGRHFYFDASFPDSTT